MWDKVHGMRCIHLLHLQKAQKITHSLWDETDLRKPNAHNTSLTIPIKHLHHPMPLQVCEIRCMVWDALIYSICENHISSRQLLLQWLHKPFTSCLKLHGDQLTRDWMNKINHDCLTEIVYYWISLTISFVLGHSKYIDVVPCCARYVVRLTCMPIKVADGLSRLCLCNCIEPCMEGTNTLTYCTTLLTKFDWR